MTEIEIWVRRFIESTSLQVKCAPGIPPAWEPTGQTVDASLVEPSLGRPEELSITLALPQSSKLSALAQPEQRALVVHKFWHHELQAAELMGLAFLRFGDAPLAFRKGLLGILQDELRHMGMYQRYLEERGYRIGQFPVRDWIWNRVSPCKSPVEFVALMGMGFEGANLDHAGRFARRFREVGDEAAAKIQDQVGFEEIAHVRFATRWFKEWTGGVEFEDFRKALPDDLGPLSVRGKLVSQKERMQAEMPEEFLNKLADWGRK